jgi:predicted transcriptional regulator
MLMVSLGKNRDRIGIIASILEAAKHRKSKTKIMLDANLSFKLLEKYLDIALTAGFVQVEGIKYVLTMQGRIFLKKYVDFQKHSLEVQKMLTHLDCEYKELIRLCDQPDQANCPTVSNVKPPEVT